ncbi:MAG TPA: glucose 1-dehydrogenase [Streptosporangiaceae bacterium]|jgi:NAD(P)-dependent dehydrogenase (short-subunit alcohol dehydrogenase family)
MHPNNESAAVTSGTPVVLVTGALTGIGRATAAAFARQGATVVVSGRHPDAGEVLAKELRELGAADAAFIAADVRHEDELRALADGVVARFGRLDVAVNNAGTEGRPGEVPDVTEDDYAAVYGTNVLGTLLSMKHELRVMRAQGSGSIINLSSIYGTKGFPGASVYVSSKHAIIGLTRSAALEAAAYGVRVNAVGPGYVETAMYTRVAGSEENKAALAGTVPQGRAGDPEEIAELILFMAADRSSYLTGQTIFLDGGVTAA